MVARVRKKSVPHFMDGPARKYMFKVLHKERWRFPDWMEWEDLVSFGIECYYEVRRRYPDAHDKRHIMALFVRVLFSRLNAVCIRRGKMVPEDKTVSLELASWVYGSSKPGAIENLAEDAPIAFALDAVPNAFRALLMRLITEGVAEVPTTPGPALQRDVALSPLYAPYRRFSEGLETLNERLCWMGGFDPKQVNIVKILADHLTPETKPPRKMIKSKRTTGDIYQKLERLGCSSQQIDRHIRALRTAPRTRVV